MQRNQFVFTFEQKNPKDPDGPMLKFKSSFNVEMIIRSMSNEDGTLAVVLHDFHEQVGKEPDIDVRNNKMKGYKNVRHTVQSEIVLNKEDAERFFNLLNIEG